MVATVTVASLETPASFLFHLVDETITNIRNRFVDNKKKSIFENIRSFAPPGENNSMVIFTQSLSQAPSACSKSSGSTSGLCPPRILSNLSSSFLLNNSKRKMDDNILFLDPGDIKEVEDIMSENDILGTQRKIKKFNKPLFLDPGDIKEVEDILSENDILSTQRSGSNVACERLYNRIL